MRNYNQYAPGILFLLSLIIVYIFLDYHSILFYRPQSIHFIRQTDCLSFVVTYFNMGMDFFEPRMLTLKSIDGKALGEFPILYYITAALYFIFGEQEFILRLINLIIVTTGLFFLFKLTNKILSDSFLSILLTLLFFSSTILIYYTNNYLPDAPALGLSLIAWYYFYYYTSIKRKKSLFFISIVLFTLSALIKVTFGLNLAASFITTLILDYKFAGIKEIIKNKRQYIIYVTSAVIIIIWYSFVLWYNNVNNASYFLTHIKPIWSLSNNQIELIFDYIYNYWYTRYYYESTLHLFLITIITGLFFIGKSNKTLQVITFSVLLGTIIYVVLFFAQFKEHDYYFIAVIPVIIFLVTNSFNNIKTKFPKIISSIVFKLVLMVMVILSLNYAREKIISRYEHVDNVFAFVGTQLNGADTHFDELGITRDSKIIVIGDNTPNGSLYFLQRRGWTFPDMDKTTDRNILNSCYQQADFMLLLNPELINDSTISFYLGERITQSESYSLYKLRTNP